GKTKRGRKVRSPLADAADPLTGPTETIDPLLSIPGEEFTTRWESRISWDIHPLPKDGKAARCDKLTTILNTVYADPRSVAVIGDSSVPSSRHQAVAACEVSREEAVYKRFRLLCGKSTSNDAELLAIQLGVHAATKPGIDTIHIFS